MRIKTYGTIAHHKFNFSMYPVYPEEQDIIYGLNSNLTENTNTDEWSAHHFLIIDYDDKLSLRNLYLELKRLIAKFSLPMIHVFESSYGHYLIFSPGVDRDYFDCLRTIFDTPCDEDYKKMRMLMPYMVGRISRKRERNKPKYLFTVGDAITESGYAAIRDKQLHITTIILDGIKRLKYWGGEDSDGENKRICVS